MDPFPSLRRQPATMTRARMCVRPAPQLAQNKAAEISSLLHRLSDVNDEMSTVISGFSDARSHTLARHRDVLQEFTQVSGLARVAAPDRGRGRVRASPAARYKVMGAHWDGSKRQQAYVSGSPGVRGCLCACNHKLGQSVRWAGALY